jgi:uncharacterized protein (DUF2141 family)
MFPLVAATLGMLGATYLGSGGSYVTLTPTPAYVEAGDEVLIRVEAVAGAPVNTVDIEVVFPEGILKPTSVDKGGSVITLWTTEPKVQSNKVHLRGGVFRKGFIGKHTIATIRARATADGSADVFVNSSTFFAGDGKGTALRVDSKSTKNAQVTVGAKGNALKGSVSVQAFTDIDGDKDVDTKDIQTFMRAWSSKTATYDFNGDGKMTFRDFAIILSDSFFK